MDALAGGGGCDDFDQVDCKVTGDHAKLGWKASEAKKVASEEPPTKKRNGDEPTAYQYRLVVSCRGNSVDSGSYTCKRALESCERAHPDSSGPLSLVYRRVVYDHGKPGDWELLGETCFTDVIPDNRQRLTMNMIKEAWAETPFARPQMAIQPKGAKTLVHLETFFAAEWPQAGFEPGEVDTVTLLGHQVRIRPTLEQYDYDLGNGRHIGPTTSPGGPWPDGDITAEYDEPGHYPTQITVTYGGEFSVDGSDWGEIPGTLDIAGPVQELTVRTAPSRLVKD